jgi:peptide-methionine (S)-S-oxide reductase
MNLEKEIRHTATLAGGCFWCTEAVFKRIEGVAEVTPGYTGGNIKNPAYREVCTGRTGHAEAIQIEYNPNLVTFEQILEVFFATHDPTTLNRQGNDTGTQYRSGIFYHDVAQKETAEAYINQLTSEKVFRNPIVTEITAFEVFYPAESEHWDYFDQNTQQPYCQYVIMPKVAKLHKHFHTHLKP